MAGWTAVVTALAVALMAIAAVVHVAAHLRYLHELRRLATRFDNLLSTLDRDARPALTSLRTAAEEGGRVATLVRSEMQALSETSKDLRSRVEGAADRLSDRFGDFETLADLLQDEIEDTVLDVAAALRTTRRGSGVLRTMKRALFKGR